MSQAEDWVLITGAAQRLGRELALGFAAAGWGVLCHYRHSRAGAEQTQAAVQALGQPCQLLAADLAQAADVEKLIAQSVALTGVVPRCVINNASIFEADSAATASAQALLAHLHTNTIAPLLLGNALHAWVQRLGAAAQPGCHSVIHVLDQKVHNLNPDYFSYTVSKLALERSVALQAQALAPLVRVCGLSPGLLYLSGPQTQDNFDRASQVNLLRQPINPADVARCALVIAQNPSLNGCTLRADNGQHLVPLGRDVMFAIAQNPDL